MFLTDSKIDAIIQKQSADVAELADALDLGSSEAIRECSSHFIRTKQEKRLNY